MNILLFNDNKVIYKYASAVSNKLNANLIECLNLIGIQIDDYDTALIDDDNYSEGLVSELRENPDLRIGVLVAKDADVPPDVDFHIVKPFLPATLLDVLANRKETEPVLDIDNDVSDKELFENDSNNRSIKKNHNANEKEYDLSSDENEDISDMLDSIDDLDENSLDDVGKSDLDFSSLDEKDTDNEDIGDIYDDANEDFSLDEEMNVETNNKEKDLDFHDDMLEQDMDVKPVDEDSLINENIGEDDNSVDKEEDLDFALQDDEDESINTNTKPTKENILTDEDEDENVEEDLDIPLGDDDIEENTEPTKEIEESILSDENKEIKEDKSIALEEEIKPDEIAEESILSDENAEEVFDMANKEEDLDIPLEDNDIKENIEPTQELEEDTLGDDSIEEVADMVDEEELDIPLEDDIAEEDLEINEEKIEEDILDDDDIEENLDASIKGEEIPESKDDVNQDTLDDIMDTESPQTDSDAIENTPKDDNYNETRQLLKKDQVDEIKDLLEDSDGSIDNASKTQINLGFEHIDYILNNYDINLTISFKRKND